MLTVVTQHVQEAFCVQTDSSRVLGSPKVITVEKLTRSSKRRCPIAKAAG